LLAHLRDSVYLDFMNDDWRLQVDFGRSEHAQELAACVDAEKLRHDLSRTFHDRVIVTVDGPRVFLYAGTRGQAEKARDAIEEEARVRDWAIDVYFRCWHPIAEEWEDPDLSLPDDDAARRSEREELMMRERDETADRGYPEFGVRADLYSRHDAVALTDQLRDEGLPVIRRWRYLLVGATDEDSAKELADVFAVRPRAALGSRSRGRGQQCRPSADRTRLRCWARDHRGARQAQERSVA
jgi:hypothetical protein